MSESTAGVAGERSGRTAASISLVLPAWNESEALPRAVGEADRALRAVSDRHEIIVVDDGSQDDTGECLVTLRAEYPALRVLRHDQNQGYGAALRTGFAAAECDLVVFTDSDVQFDLAEINRFALLARDYDIVCGYRIDRKDAPLRCFYSRVYNLLVRTLVGTSVRDIDCAFKMFRRDKLQQLPVTTDGFLVNTELLTAARQNGFSVVEVGVTHRPRVEGESTVSVSHIPVVLASLVRFWWNRVQFPGTAVAAREPAGPTQSGHSDRRLAWLQASLLVVAAVLLLSGLSYPLIDRDETRYAEIPREMVVSGDWLVPKLNYKTYYDKPPLLYWACAASYSVFGVSEWSARLVPALSGVLTLAMTMAFGNRLFNRRVGLLAGGVLALSVGFLGASRILLIDGLLSAFVALALFAACEAIREQRLRRGWWLLASFAVGVGFMAKGPIALVLFLPPVTAYAWLTQGAARLNAVSWLLLTAVVTLIAAPWFIAVSREVPDFAYQFFYLHNVERFGGAFHAKPLWFFLPVLLIGGHPWSFLALPCASYLGTRSQAVGERRTPILGFMVLWAVWCFAFFTISRCKLPPYILPAAPALALVVGKCLEDILWQREGIKWSRYTTGWAPWLATSTTIIASVGFIALGAWSGFESLRLLIVSSIIGISLLFVVRWTRQNLQGPKTAWGICAVATLLAATVVLHREIPRYATAQTLFGPASPLRGQFAATPDVPVVTVGHEWSGVPFYLHRDDIANFDHLDGQELVECADDAGRVLLIYRDRGHQELAPAFLPAGARVVATADRGQARLFLIELDGPGELVARPASLDAPLR
ncbi:Undecaprenyl phosphate-alpha-4-amino-4-deoxy-L-arabinose arabinosyl transferase [Posidoniimonas polymericola]|uniref:Undecaprenyl phosphate-alpha-4-amino-4-deoxy-L-arabinose arabinosyl transferase n=1 Tax=Posidoniimonas polymericola TaxID=2528002 RepID=A0A5C5YMR8_9BACT|nr:glycosyltransferase [Posidoniimonas polymericola]TWT76155.1 Undecaprenyl phosphate-alpha-4-amino-4-deoxy-L-arabinose arabinosyl transferase [Posidoniimonas polymericola]